MDPSRIPSRGAGCQKRRHRRTRDSRRAQVISGAVTHDAVYTVPVPPSQTRPAGYNRVQNEEGRVPRRASAAGVGTQARPLSGIQGGGEGVSLLTEQPPVFSDTESVTMLNAVLPPIPTGATISTTWEYGHSRRPSAASSYQSGAASSQGDDINHTMEDRPHRSVEATIKAIEAQITYLATLRSQRDAMERYMDHLDDYNRSLKLLAVGAKQKYAANKEEGKRIAEQREEMGLHRARLKERFTVICSHNKDIKEACYDLEQKHPESLTNLEPIEPKVRPPHHGRKPSKKNKDMKCSDSGSTVPTLPKIIERNEISPRMERHRRNSRHNEEENTCDSIGETNAGENPSAKSPDSCSRKQYIYTDKPQTSSIRSTHNSDSTCSRDVRQSPSSHKIFAAPRAPTCSRIDSSEQSPGDRNSLDERSSPQSPTRPGISSSEGHRGKFDLPNKSPFVSPQITERPDPELPQFGRTETVDQNIKLYK